jgi:hypothetical protein
MMKYTFFVLMKATKHWLALSRAERNQFVAESLQPLFAKYPTVTARFYDAEAFTTHFSDITVFETEVIQDYYFLIEGLRDTAIFTLPYFDFVEIIPAIEGGFGQYEAAQ